MKNKISDVIYFLIYLIFNFIFKFTPKIIQNFFIDSLSYLFYKFDKKHKKIIMTNLNIAYENSLTDIEKENIAKNTFKNYMHFGVDFIKNQNIKKEDLLKKVVFVNEHIIKKALAENQTIITQTIHYGNWELLSLGSAAKFGELAIIGRNLDSKLMDKILTKNRTQFHIELLSKNGSIKKVLEVLRSKKPLGLLVDQNTSAKEGIEVSFFNKRVMHTPSASILALKSNSIIIPTFIKKISRDTHQITFYEPIIVDKNIEKNEAIKKATQAQADISEKIIREKPDEYFWFHKRFKHFYEEKYAN